KASASAKSGARREETQDKRRSACCATAVSTRAPFGAPPPLICLEAPFRTVPYSSGAEGRAARTGALVHLAPRTVTLECAAGRAVKAPVASNKHASIICLTHSPPPGGQRPSTSPSRAEATVMAAGLPRTS